MPALVTRWQYGVTEWGRICLLVLGGTAAALLGGGFSRLISSRRASILAGLTGAVGSICLAVAPGEAGMGIPLLTFGGALLTSAGMVVLLYRSAAMFSRLPPWSSMVTFMASQALAACIYLIVYSACSGPLSVSLHVALPLMSAALFAMPINENDDIEAPGYKMRVASFAQLLLPIFVFRLAANLGRHYLVVQQGGWIPDEGVTGNALMKILVAIVICAYAFVPLKRLDLGLACYSIFVACAAALVSVPLVGRVAPSVMFAVCGTLSGVVGNLAFCMLASICFRTGYPPVLVFSAGYSANFLGGAVGMPVAECLTGSLQNNSEPLTIAVITCLLLAFALLVSPPSVIRSFNFLPFKDGAPEGRPSPFRIAWDERCDLLASEYGLTPREKETLVLLARGMTYQQASTALDISLNTFRSHARGAYSKLGVHSRGELISLIESMDERELRK